MSTEKEKEKGGFFNVIKSTFLHEEEESPSPAPAEDEAPRHAAPRPAPPPPARTAHDPDVVRKIDEQATAQLQAPVEAVAGTYAEFMASMEALAEAVPDVAQRQKAVIKLMTKKKIPLPRILNDLDACIGALEQEGRTFRSESEKHMTRKVGGLKQEVEAIGASMSAKQAQIASLEAELAALRTSKDVKENEVRSAESHAALVQERFNIIYSSTHAAMTAQRKQVSDLIDKEQQ